MVCQRCGTEMNCVDDVNDISVRIDWLRCPKCDSFAEIEYDPRTGIKTKISWVRNHNWSK